jgi:hypothetical protein
MNTKFWGPGGWIFLHTISFNYPIKIDESDPWHRKVRQYYKQLYENLQYTLPCKYCRKSYKKFLKELPISQFLDSRKGITLWLYQIHNKVNAKLRKQEQELLMVEAKKLSRQGFSKQKLKQELKKLARKILFTGPDPSYHKVCKFYEKQRAACGKKPGEIASCRI